MNSAPFAEPKNWHCFGVLTPFPHASFARKSYDVAQDAKKAAGGRPSGGWFG